MSPTLTWVPHFHAAIASSALALFLTGVESIIIMPPSVSNYSTFTSSSGQNVTSENVTIENALTVKCDGAQYGLDLNAAECRTAREYIQIDSQECPWVERGYPFADYHFAVPFRWMGGTKIFL